ncbi:MAG TPA: hypothetical protein GXZ20_08170 [Halanaerobiaceae bacterium]|nr:DUF5696 domain-containing protein [Bacillota bacterium]HHU93090.1 hypothetical protein [Halanaerobiaceae bacterium]HOA41609.1 DUF5696 domain-containing protein [Halanaerobiales bacterium]HPZ63211.1 DUF5696 domain-containing protein [Halanaerobiales bacterium]HQD04437.1 DUF5696 domain-containing protein [Halanaerobiales bacterium]
MRRKGFWAILLAFYIISGLFAVDLRAADLDAYSLVAENEHLILYLNYDTTEVAVQEKDSGIIWYSNPPGRDKEEKVARGSDKDVLNAQFSLSYYLPGNRQMFMNNYSDSILFNQYEINLIENGVSIDYVVGQEWKKEDLIPLIIEQKSMEEKVLKNLPVEEQEFLLSQYHLFGLEPLGPEGRKLDIYNFDEDGVLGNYAFTTPLEEMRERDFERLVLHFLGIYVNNRNDLASIADLKAEDLNYLKDKQVYVQKRTIRAWDRDNIFLAFQNSGYSPEELAKDYQELNLEPPVPNQRVFHVTIDYLLDGKDFLVRVPLDKVTYPEKVLVAGKSSMETYPLYSLDILPYFGAAGSDAEGYIFVPDGSGALIYLNNGRLDAKPYGKNLYGLDYALQPRERIPEITEQLHIPVYGLKNGDKAFLAIIEEGDAFANIKADIAGRTSSYNTVQASFITMQRTELVFGYEWEETKMSLFQSRLPEGNIQIRYSFLNGEKANYVGMAHRYQEYLVGKYKLSPLEERENIPFMLELLTSIHETKPVLGIPRRLTKAVTNFQQVKEIIEELDKEGIKDLKLRLTGWLAGGEHHYLPRKLRLEKTAGTEKDFKDLLTFLEAKGIEVYPDLSFYNIYKTNLWNDFLNRRYAARFLNRKIASIPDYNLATKQEKFKGGRLLLSSKFLSSFVDNFLKEYSKYNIGALSLRHLGQQLNSDYRTNPAKNIDRQQSLNNVVNVLKKLKEEQEVKLLVEGGNAYTLPYVDQVVKTPLYSTGANIIDKGIPFLPIVLHGYIDYSGQPLNMLYNQYSLLKSMETGAIPYYRGIYSESSAVKRTVFENEYALNYRQWLPEAAELYQALNELLKETYNQRIIDHMELADNVFKTVYANGKAVIVNYNQEAVMVEGVEVKGEDFKVIQEDLQ